MTSYSIPLSQKLLHKQGVGTRSAAIRNRFIRRSAVWFLLITVLALFYVWSRVQVVQLGYELTKLRNNYEELSKRAAALETEVEGLKSPKRLEEVAVQRLGMGAPRGDQVVLVKP